MITARVLDLRRTAIHEAGHAVAFIRICNSHHGPVTLKPEGEAPSLGRSVGFGLEHIKSPKDAENQVFIHLAGYAALIAAGEAHDDAATGAEQDLQEARKAIEVDPENWTAR